MPESTHLLTPARFIFHPLHLAVSGSLTYKAGIIGLHSSLASHWVWQWGAPVGAGKEGGEGAARIHSHHSLSWWLSEIPRDSALFLTVSLQPVNTFVSVLLNFTKCSSNYPNWVCHLFPVTILNSTIITKISFLLQFDEEASFLPSKSKISFDARKMIQKKAESWLDRKGFRGIILNGVCRSSTVFPWIECGFDGCWWGVVPRLAMIFWWQTGPTICSTWFHIWFSTVIDKALVFKISIITLLYH